jgi:hypothetical protein
MSDRDRAIDIIERLPENKILYVLTYLQGLQDGLAEVPNNETLQAFSETDKLISEGKIKPFTGATDDFLNDILAEG